MTDIKKFFNKSTSKQIFTSGFSVDEYLTDDDMKSIRKKYPYYFTCISCDRLVLSITDEYIHTDEDNEGVCKKCVYTYPSKGLCDIKEFLEYLTPNGKKKYYKNLLKDEEFVIIHSVSPTVKEIEEYCGKYDCLLKWKIEDEEEEDYKFVVYNGSSRFAMWLCKFNFEY